MSSPPLHVTVIVASTRDGRLGPSLSGWFLGRLDQRVDMVVDVVDLADIPLPNSLDPADAEIVALRPRLAAADAFVLIVPEYNRSIPGPMKTLIDCYNAEWEAKPVAFVSYGLSRSGGVRAVEHLRQIFSEFHAVGMKDTVTFPRINEHFDAEGNFTVDRTGSDTSAKTMLDQLSWWARTLRDAKAERPYRS